MFLPQIFITNKYQVDVGDASSHYVGARFSKQAS